MPFKQKNPALILIDIQKGFEDQEYWGGNRNNPDAEKICGNILAKWRELNLPIFHVRLSSTNPVSRLHKNHWGFAFNENVQPLTSGTVITKNVNSAFIGTNLKELLDEKGISTLVIVGLITNHCVSTTARMAGNFGYETFVISDATATFDREGINGEKFDAETIHQISLASLQEEFATILTAQQLLENM